MAKPAAHGSAKGTSYLVIAFHLINVLFISLGIALLGVSSVAYHDLQDVSSVIATPDHAVFSASLIGVVIFVVAIVGFVGVKTHNQSFMIAYSTFLIIIVACELLITAVCIYEFYAHLETTAVQNLERLISEYESSNSTKTILDNLQWNLKCCGANDTDVWLDFQTNSDSFPESCCEPSTSICSEPDFDEPCAQLIRDTVLDSSRVLMGVLFAFAFVQMIGLVVSLFLTNVFKFSYTAVNNDVRRF